MYINVETLVSKDNHVAVEGHELTWNLTAHSLVSRSGHSHVWCKQRGSYSGLMRTFDGELYSLCFQSETKALLSYSSGFSFNASACHPYSALTLREKTFQANSRDKDFLLSPLPRKVQKERKLAEAQAQDQMGRWQERIQTESLKHFALFSIFPLFLCSFSISFTISMGFGDCIEMMVIEVPVAN